MSGTDRHEIIQVIGNPSPPAEEEIAALAMVFRQWAWDVRVLAPMTRPLRRRLAAAHVRAQEAPEQSGESIIARWHNARSLADSLAAARPVLIHAHDFRAGLGALVNRSAVGEEVPVVLSPHFRPGRIIEDPRAGLRRRGYRWVLSRADAIVVETETQRAQLAQIDRRAAERAEIVPYGISAGRPEETLDLGRRRQILGITPSAAVVGCVVDSMHDDEVRLFLDAAAEVCMQYPSLEFALVGSDVDRARYHNLAHERGLMGATVFVDPGERFIRALSSLNVLVTPQRGWPTGMLALQALKENVGVVGFEGSELQEILADAPRVALAEPGSVSSLASAIIRRLHDAAEQMAPDVQEPEAAAVSPFLVSRESYDLGEAWDRPGRTSEKRRKPHDPTREFSATRAARALISVYDRLLGNG